MKNRLFLSAAFLVPLVVMFFSGCVGYQVGSAKPSVFADVEKIHVPTFQNETLEPRYAVLVTNAVISALQQDGTYQITDEANADAILRGKIVRNDRRQQRSVDTNILRTRELLSLTQVNYHLETPDGEVIHQGNPFGIDVNQVNAVTGQRDTLGTAVGRSSTFLDDNFQLSERQALALAAEDAALTMVNALTNGW